MGIQKNGIMQISCIDVCLEKKRPPNQLMFLINKPLNISIENKHPSHYKGKARAFHTQKYYSQEKLNLRMQWEDDQTIQNCFKSSQVSCCKNGDPPPSENKDPKTKTPENWA